MSNRYVGWSSLPAQATLSPRATPSAPALSLKAPWRSRNSKAAADEKTLGVQPTESLLLLALRLKAAGDRESAASVSRQAWRMRPDDFWVNYEMARLQGAEAERSPRSFRVRRGGPISDRGDRRSAGQPHGHSNLGGSTGSTCTTPTRPSPSFARRSVSSPITPRPITTSAPRRPRKGNPRKRLPNISPRFALIPTWPKRMATSRIC